MSGEVRETELRISGRSFTVRTETGGRIRTAKQLEAAHYRNVREAIEQARTVHIEARYQDLLPSEADEAEAIRGVRSFWMKGAHGPIPERESAQYDARVRHRIAAMRERAESYAADARKRAKPAPVDYTDHAKLRAPHPAVKYTYPDVPASVRHLVAEGEA